MTNFWQAIEIIDQESNTVNIEYRVYYDKSGNIKFYTCENVESNYEYLIIDKETYERANYNLIVQNNKLKKNSTNNISQKLVHSNEGVICDINDICVISNEGQHWQLRRYI